MRLLVKSGRSTPPPNSIFSATSRNRACGKGPIARPKQNFNYRTQERFRPMCTPIKKLATYNKNNTKLENIVCKKGFFFRKHFIIFHFQIRVHTF